jgi:hypothetical protein
MGFAGMTQEKLGNAGRVLLTASNLDFERRRPDGSICRYVRLRISYQHAETRSAQHPLLANTDARQCGDPRTATVGLCVDLAVARIQSALQALRATAHEGRSPGLDFWDIDLPAVVSELSLPGKNQHPALVIVIEPSASVRCALCEFYLPDENMECFGACDAHEALEWARLFGHGQIAALVLPEASYTPEIDQLLEESPNTSVLLIGENASLSRSLLKNSTARTEIVDRLASHELLSEKLKKLLGANSGLLLDRNPATA